MKSHCKPRKPEEGEGSRRRDLVLFFAGLRVLGVFAVCSLAACAAGPQLARVELTCPQGQLAVDGAPAGEVKGKARFSLRPGHHVFEVRGPDGSVETREADLGPGDQVALELGGASR